MVDKDERIQVIVRKRPLSSKELQRGEADILEQRGPRSLVVREQKVKVDLTKYIEEHLFTFDRVFNEDVPNLELYETIVQPLVVAAFESAKVTCFAYGQTGSGKTFTMMGEGTQFGLYALAARDLFYVKERQYPQTNIFVSFYEIYCSKLHDLLNDRNLLFAREDAKQNVNIVGLQRKLVNDYEELMEVINYGLAERTTGQTGANDESSRSHAVLEIVLRENKRTRGKMSFIDLAGSERGADVNNSDGKTRMDSAEINKSLLALKECIRALDQDKKHTPFRGSKLTQVLKDSFIGNCRTVMIANLSPGLSSCEHSLNTLRYSDRVKELGGPKNTDNIMMLPRQPANSTRVNSIPTTDDSEVDVRSSGRRKNTIPMKQVASSKLPQPSKIPSKIPTAASKIPTRAAAKSPPANPSRLLTKSPQQSTRSSPSKVPPQKNPSSPRGPCPLEAMTEDHEHLVALLLKEEDELLSAHRKMVDATVELIKHQMSLLSQVDKPESSIHEYVSQMECVLDMKEELFAGIRSRIETFRNLQEQEALLAQPIPKPAEPTERVEEDWLI